MSIEMLMAEYHQPLDDLLLWSSGRLSVLFRRRNERSAAIRKMFKTDQGRDRGPTHRYGRRGAVPGPGSSHHKEVVCNSMAELAAGLRVKAEPYPGTTPWNKGV